MSSWQGSRKPTTQQVTTSDSSKKYSCNVCGFSSDRVGVITAHSKSHGSEPIKTKSKPIKRQPAFLIPSPALPKLSSPKTLKTTKTTPVEKKPRGRPKKSTVATPVATSTVPTPKKLATPKKIPTPSPSKKRKHPSPKKEIIVAKDILDDWKDSDEDETPHREVEEPEEKVPKKPRKDYQNIFDNLLQTKVGKAVESTSSTTTVENDNDNKSDIKIEPIDESISENDIKPPVTSISSVPTSSQDAISTTNSSLVSTDKESSQSLSQDSVGTPRKYTKINVEDKSKESIITKKDEESMEETEEEVEKEENQNSSSTEASKVEDKDSLESTINSFLDDTDKNLAALNQVLYPNSVQNDTSIKNDQNNTTTTAPFSTTTTSTTTTTHPQSNISQDEPSLLKKEEQEVGTIKIESSLLSPPSPVTNSIKTKNEQEEEISKSVQDIEIDNDKGSEIQFQESKNLQKTTNGEEAQMNDTNNESNEDNDTHQNKDLPVSSTVDENLSHEQEKLTEVKAVESQKEEHKDNDIVNGECETKPITNSSSSSIIINSSVSSSSCENEHVKSTNITDSFITSAIQQENFKSVEEISDKGISSDSSSLNESKVNSQSAVVQRDEITTTVSKVDQVSTTSSTFQQLEKENRTKHQEKNDNNITSIESSSDKSATTIMSEPVKEKQEDIVKSEKFLPRNVPSVTTQESVKSSQPNTTSNTTNSTTSEPKDKVPVEQIVHLVPVQNPDGSVQCMFISLGDNDELKIAETESAVPPPNNLEAIYIDKDVDAQTLMRTLTQNTPRQQQQLIHELQQQQLQQQQRQQQLQQQELQLQLQQQQLASQAPSRQPPVSQQFKQMTASAIAAQQSQQQQIQYQQQGIQSQQQQYIQDNTSTTHYQIMAGNDGQMQEVISQIDGSTITTTNNESPYVAADEYNQLMNHQQQQQQQYIFVMDDGSIVDPTTVGIHDLQQLLSQPQQHQQL